MEPVPYPCPHCSVILDVSEVEPFTEICCPNCETSMRVRTRFDHFELTEPIASGGMGTVYKARDVNLNRIVAFKLLRREFSADHDYIEKLETEARITASVNHPHVVKVFSFGSDQGQYYIAMELVERGSLDQLMTLQGRIAEVQVLEIGIQIAMGLRAAFQVGLIHRDVKPGNILFADAHTAKVVDFGLALPLEQAREETEGDIWGTPYYVAPEKLNHDPEDFRSDIYSLGGTLFHALAGRPPFEAENASLVALKHLKSQAVSLQAFAPDISGPTAYVINRTLAKNPEERYQSYDELVEHLEYARAQLLENSGKPPQAKTRVVVEGADQQEAFGYINMAIIAFVVVLGIVLFLFKDTILAHRLSVEDLEAKRREKGATAMEQFYQETRKQMLSGTGQEAFSTFKDLEERPNAPQPLKNWVVLHETIAAFLENRPQEAHLALNRLHRDALFSYKAEDAKLTGFFADVSRILLDEHPTAPSLGKDFMTADFEPIALFAFALKAWGAGRFDDAVSFLQQFAGTTPTGQWHWIEDFKPLSKRFLDDYDASQSLREKLAAATPTDARTALLPEIAVVRAKLQLPGRLANELENDEETFKRQSGVKVKGWSSADVSRVEIPGHSSLVNGVFRIVASGTDIGATSDSFRLVFQSMAGDSFIVAQLASADNTHRFSKAGVMMRENLDGDSKCVAVLSTPEAVEFDDREAKRGQAKRRSKVDLQTPCWLKLVRKGDSFTAFTSKDGASWRSLGSPLTVPMNSTIDVGLAVCSYEKGALKSATFDHISVGVP